MILIQNTIENIFLYKIINKADFFPLNQGLKLLVTAAAIGVMYKNDLC